MRSSSNHRRNRAPTFIELRVRDLERNFVLAEGINPTASQTKREKSFLENSRRVDQPMVKFNRVGLAPRRFKDAQWSGIYPVASRTTSPRSAIVRRAIQRTSITAKAKSEICFIEAPSSTVTVLSHTRTVAVSVRWWKVGCKIWARGSWRSQRLLTPRHFPIDLSGPVRKGIIYFRMLAGRCLMWVEYGSLSLLCGKRKDH
jgi:hypothetical protein